MESRDRLRPLLIRIACVALAGSGVASAHHSYTMFDTSRELSATGVMAKFEWKNPHTYLWVYIPSKTETGKYEAWAFENGSPSVLSKLGWSRASIQPNDRIILTYAPLRSGKPGGHCIRITLPDGRSLECVGFGPGSATAAR